MRGDLVELKDRVYGEMRKGGKDLRPPHLMAIADIEWVPSIGKVKGTYSITEDRPYNIKVAWEFPDGTTITLPHNSRDVILCGGLNLEDHRNELRNEWRAAAEAWRER